MRLRNLGLAALLAWLSACAVAAPSTPEQDFIWLLVTTDHCSFEGKDFRTKAELVAALKQVSRKEAVAVQVVVSMRDKKAAAQTDAMLSVVREAFLEARMRPAGLVRNEVF